MDVDVAFRILHHVAIRKPALPLFCVAVHYGNVVEVLRAPLKVGQLLVVASALTFGVTAYCLIYTGASGRPEPPSEGIAWTFVNVLPWLAAFEASKRVRGVLGWAAILAVAFVVSLALGLALGEAAGAELEVTRRIPGLLITALLIVAAPLAAKPGPKATSRQNVSLPLPPEQIEWIAAAGNYVEIHCGDRTIVHRTPLSAIEAELSKHGFVRIHRSIVVRRDHIARVRPLDIILRDGTSLRTGKRYRALLQAENLVPSSHRAGSTGPIDS